MSRMISSILMIGSIGYFIYRYRFRIMNLLLASTWLRQLAVASMMGLPGVKNKLMQSVFGKPSEW